jgi:hypothetical protein
MWYNERMNITVTNVSRISTKETIHYYAEGSEWFRCIIINLYDEEGENLGQISAHSVTGKGVERVEIPADAFGFQTNKE